MKRIRKNSYVARELRRRQYEAQRRFREKVIDVVSSIALVVASEAIMFALLLM